MHSTYPTEIQRHPGLWGGLLGALIGALLMLGALVILDRVDLTITSQPAQPVGFTQTTTEMLRAHWLREHAGPVAAASASALRPHFLREHRLDMPAPASVTPARHFAIEYAADMVLPVTFERHLVLEHRGDIGP